MPTIAEIQHKVNSLLERHAQAPAVGPAAAFAPTGSRSMPPFSEFVTEHLDAAIDLAEQFMAIADGHGDDTEALDAVLDVSSTALTQFPSGLVDHALMLFILHDPRGRRLRIPSLQRRSPGQVYATSLTAAAAATAPQEASSLWSGSTPPEHRMDWFREDPLANEHHQHWHVVYPRRGIPGSNPRRLKDRHGELFLYMHQQMLARYDAERIATPGLEPVKPFTNYREPILEGYDPGGLMTVNPSGEFDSYSARPTGTVLRDLEASDIVGVYSILDHERYRDRTLDAIDSGFFRQGEEFVDIPEGLAGSELLGLTNETTMRSVSTSFYGNHHGFGHVLSALAIADGTGVMWNTATAIRDPFFWRWHRHVDDLYFRHQERSAPHSFSDAPDVTLRSNGSESLDLIVCRLDDLETIGDPDIEGAEIGNHAFGEAGGNARWDTDFSATESYFHYQGQDQSLPAVAELTTSMHRGIFTLSNGHQVGFPYLSHERFCYFIRVQNNRDVEQRITVRIFLAPTEVNDVDAGAVDDPNSDSYVNNRRSWIELDKFDTKLAPSERTVLFRKDSESSVIRRPVVDPDNVVDLEPTNDPDDGYCECGWPYHLLLPRGTTAGMYFRLFVMITDGEIDQVPNPSQCGSMSFCGLRDEYPDTRAMGYPFDRPFVRGGFTATLSAQPNSTSRRLAIRCVKM